MKIIIENDRCALIKESTDPKFSGTINARGEASLLRFLATLLNQDGYDLIKRYMRLDGYSTNTMQQYLRPKKMSGNPKYDIFIFNDNFIKEGAERPYNINGIVHLKIRPYIPLKRYIITNTIFGLHELSSIN